MKPHPTIYNQTYARDEKMQMYEVIITTLIGGGIGGYLLRYMLDLKMLKHTGVMSKKREVYENIATAMSIFLQGRIVSDEDRDKFLSETRKIWLWASDLVVRAMNSFVDIMKEDSTSRPLDQERAKTAYAKFVLEMRKDIGFPKTTLAEDGYKFVG